MPQKEFHAEVGKLYRDISIVAGVPRDPIVLLSAPCTMRAASLFLVIALVTIAVSACRLQTVNHSPSKAAFDANQFLKALYSDEDYLKALNLAADPVRQSASADDLKKMVEKIKQEHGTLKRLKADSYLMTQGQSMELFYIGEYEHGFLFHRLVLIGDASSEYKVAGVWFQSDPYPTSPLRHKFETEILAF